MRLRAIAAALVLAVLPSASAFAQQPPAPPGLPAVTFEPTPEPPSPAPEPAAPAPAANVEPAPVPAPALGAVTFEPAAPYASEGPDVAKGPERRQGDFHLDVGFGTELPISVGGVVTAELPHRFLLQLGLGFMPHGYAYAIDDVLTSAGAYDKTISALIRNALGNSFVLRAGAGWRPFTDHGFEIMGGYTLMTLGGETTAADVVNAVLVEGGSSQRVSTATTMDIPVSATLHNFHVSLGWRWLMADDHMVIRASLSYLQCVASNVGVNLAAAGSQAAAMQGAVNDGLNSFLGPYFRTYAKAPTVGLSAAYRF